MTSSTTSSVPRLLISQSVVLDRPTACVPLIVRAPQTADTSSTAGLSNKHQPRPTTFPDAPIYRNEQAPTSHRSPDDQHVRYPGFQTFRPQSPMTERQTGFKVDTGVWLMSRSTTRRVALLIRFSLIYVHRVSCPQGCLMAQPSPLRVSRLLSCTAVYHPGPHRTET